MTAGRRATRASGIPPIRLRARRSSPPCARPATVRTAVGCAALIVGPWRAGLRIHEALALAKADLVSAAAPCSCVAGRVDAGARSAWTRGVGPSCIPGSRGVSSVPSDRCSACLQGDLRASVVNAGARTGLRRTAVAAGVRRRFAPRQLRHAHAVELVRERVPLIVTQRQVGDSNLGITSVYLQGVANAEIIDTVQPPRADDPGQRVGSPLNPDRASRWSSRQAALTRRAAEYRSHAEAAARRRLGA
jgi:hypothetical protein